MLLRKTVTFYTFLKCLFVLLFFTKCARFAYFYTENVQKPLKIIRFLRKSGRRFVLFLQAHLQCLYSLLTVPYCFPNFRFVTFLQPLMGIMSSQSQALHTGMLHLMCSVRLFGLNG